VFQELKENSTKAKVTLELLRVLRHSYTDLNEARRKSIMRLLQD
jgi:hypothetical protein